MILDCVQEHIRQVYAIPGHTIQTHVSINVVVSTLTNVVVTTTLPHKTQQTCIVIDAIATKIPHSPPWGIYIYIHCSRNIKMELLPKLFHMRL